MADAAPPIRIFVTVGSTKFAHLIAAILSKSVIDAIGAAVQSAHSRNLGASVKLTVQYGATSLADVLTEQGSALVQSDGDTCASGSRNSDGSTVHPSASAQTVAASLLFEEEDDPNDESRVSLSGKEDALSDAALRATFMPTPKDKANEDDTLQASAHERRQTLQRSGSGEKGNVRQSEAATESQASPRHRNLRFRVPTSTGTTVNLQLVAYVNSIRPYLEQSDIVISHAGSGTIIEALRLDRPPKLVVVPNETLMDNHQTELALALSKQRYVLATRVGAPGDPNQLPALLGALIKSLTSPTEQDFGARSILITPFPAFVPGRFVSLMDEQMGYTARSPQTSADDSLKASLPTSLLLALASIVMSIINMVAARILAVPRDRVLPASEQEEAQEARLRVQTTQGQNQRR